MQEVNRRALTNNIGCVTGFEVTYIVQDEKVLEHLIQTFTKGDSKTFSVDVKGKDLTITFGNVDGLTKTILVKFNPHFGRDENQIQNEILDIIDEGQRIRPKDVEAYRKLCRHQERRLEAFSGELRDILNRYL